jgi:hypothetical protein
VGGKPVGVPNISAVFFKCISEMDFSKMVEMLEKIIT